MASTTAPPALFLLGSKKGGKSLEKAQIRSNSNGRRRRRNFCVLASETSSGQRRRSPPGVDTRIHWDSPDEGWIGGSTNSSQRTIEEEQQNLLGKNYSDLLEESSDSHYQFLGVSAEADLEEIKAAYRGLSKDYHPDTTSLPLKAASDKFMKLREVYDTLSNEERRKFYDWTLAQEAASRQAEKMKMKLEDPREQEVRNWESIPDMVDRLGGRNMELSDQAMTALTIDVFAVIFSICCIIVYALFFQDP
ncbi:NAD(P)H-quinone oxidoreductase subunit T, chloroplastic-like [Macadamia integrifolia]|uniref:NAD(P)H-quinone oxidoreductase subunit T, chloroplastic-like n=1 Tax=Macadamia integrifolia TaxID=60698 RepID=UPI001C4FF015|nr:NAD(P)H-quinone oxidoreductase subunit T, chloroplastic-like [Macadamia integrifolia]XP_042481894.1 NAD(P)H-quinone oxidoreductase subunit T, chloroplastic-like [Macadamia integrifolia]XP_042481895.1 NAD(P)H-quinone oxidoreductase subunit T, chloroplastic-like [Macadamia integrifolia]XP_042481896.1 NAD(P)H-quinone oxidoreductase subunit T, chloroplastic-like [Macadamia integrifolia]